MKMSTTRWLLTLRVTARACGAAVRPQAQKKLVVYTSNDSTLNDLVFAAFRKETGIEVEPVAAGLRRAGRAACRPRRARPAGRHHLGHQPLRCCRPTRRCSSPTPSKNMPHAGRVR
jgi:hypothetical protein